MLRSSIMRGRSSIDSMRSLQLTIVGPYLHEDPHETWASLQRKMHWVDLHLLFVDYHSPLVALDALERMLKLPGFAAQLNARDTRSRPPLYYASRVHPEAVEVMLRAGTNPWLVEESLVYAAVVGADAAIGPLIRAGADINAHDQYGRTALHLAALPADKASSGLQRYQVALALLRHGRHSIDWDARDIWSRTPLDVAQQFARTYPLDDRFRTTVELYASRKVPSHARYIPPRRVVELEDGETPARSTSLVQAGLRGDCEAVGQLISRGAMVNEGDDDGHTLLHLVAMGRAQDGYKVALELVRYGGYSVDWEAQTPAGDTAITLARERLARADCEEARDILCLLEAHRLPLGERYIFPCMDPDYCRRCSSIECTCAGFSMPGGFE